MELQELGKRAKAAEIIMRNLGMKEKENILLEVAEHLVEDSDAILAANQKDMDAGSRIRRSGRRSPFHETAPEWTYDWKEACTIRCHWNYL